MRSVVRLWLRVTVGVLLGAVTAIGELLFVAYAGLLRLGRRPSTNVLEQARRIADVERSRLATFFGTHVPPARAQPATVAYLAVRSAVGGLGGVVLLTGAIGIGYATFPAWGWLVADLTSTGSIILGSLGGLFLAFLCVLGVTATAALEAHVAMWFGESDNVRDLQQRLGELTSSRAGVRSRLTSSSSRPMSTLRTP